MRTSKEVKEDIKSRMKELVGQDITEGTLIDLFNVAISEVAEDIYQEIEDSKNPHIWSNLFGDQLDDMGTMLNISRRTGELDETYKYRIMNWVLSNATSNTTAIETGLLTPEYSANISFYPYTKGAGTGTCYVIPNEYTTENIVLALEEAKERMAKVSSPALHVEYVIPEMRKVDIQICISSDEGDLSLIESNIESQVSTYVNALAPGEYLEAGAINKIGIAESYVDYFSVMSIIVDDVTISGIKILQEIDSKFIFDKIIWTEE